MSGIVYFLTNKAMAGLVKVGYTCGPINERVEQLNSTGVPVPFDVAACFIVNNPIEVEQEIHSCLEKYRLRKNREFFEVSVAVAIETSFPIILKHICDNNSNSSKGAVSEKSHGLEANTALLLKWLADSNRNYGYDELTLSKDIDESEIEVVNRLVTLKEMGLVEEKKTRDEYRPSRWKITSKGVKFIFDNNLVEGYMKDDKRF